MFVLKLWDLATNLTLYSTLTVGEVQIEVLAWLIVAIFLAVLNVALKLGFWFKGYPILS